MGHNGNVSNKYIGVKSLKSIIQAYTGFSKPKHLFNIFLKLHYFCASMYLQHVPI